MTSSTMEASSLTTRGFSRASPWRSARIGIIGAGMAGLSAASHLTQKGFNNVTLLEGSNRVGGRIHTMHLCEKGSGPHSTSTDLHCNTRSPSCSGGLVELGANFIDGDSLTNSFLVLALQHGLLPGNLHYSDRSLLVSKYTYTSDGKALEGDFSTKVWDLFEAWMGDATQVQQHTRKYCNTEEFLREKLESSLKDYPDIQQDDVRAVFNSFINWRKVDQGVNNLNDLPLQEGYCKPPGKPIIMTKKGMGSVVHALAQNLPDNVVKFNQHVVNIVWDGPDVIVKTKLGQVFRFDHVIVTFPLGHLKHNFSRLFEPQLPQAKTTAIEKIPVGILGKIIMYWDMPFWKAGYGNINLAWRDEFLADTNPEHDQWWTQIEVFTEVPNNRHVLVAWVPGKAMKQAETLPLDNVRDAVTKVLRMFLGNQSIPQPDHVMRSGWATNPLYLGSYSYWNKEMKSDYMKDLAEPLVGTMQGAGDVPKVLFAGEATNATGYGYVHGARDSGLRESQRIISFYDKHSISRM